MAETPPVSGLSLRELILELRADVRNIDIKLEHKADRQRVHDLANEINVMKIQRAAEAAARAEYDRKVGDLQLEMLSMRNWRNRLAGGLAVVGAFSGALGAHLAGLF